MSEDTTEDTTDDGEAPTLTDEEQQALAVEWFFAMWGEALKRGVANEKLTVVCLSSVVSQLVGLYGENGAAELIGKLPDKILDGQFTVGT